MRVLLVSDLSFRLQNGASDDATGFVRDDRSEVLPFLSIGTPTVAYFADNAGRDLIADLFLIDYHLSDTDGVTLIQAIRQIAEFRQIPIVVTSGLNVEREALAVGASEFLIKPFDPDYLPRLFHRLIGA